MAAYNADVRNLTMGADGYIDTALALNDSDPAYANLPRTDLFVPSAKSCGTTDASTTVTMADTSGLYPGNTMGIRGTGIPAGATIVAVTRNTSVTINTPATATGSVTCSFASAALAGDGVHWSVQVGIPHLKANLSVPAFTVP